MLIFSLLACAGTPELPADMAPTEAPAELPPPLPLPMPTPLPAAPEGVDLSAYGDSYVVIEAPTLSGTALTVKVRHGGGCAEHGWTLAAGAPSEGELPVALVHSANGDLCRALLFSEVKLDLAQAELSLCGVSRVALKVPMGPDGASPGSFSLAVDEALSRCEGIVPEEAPEL